MKPDCYSSCFRIIEDQKGSRKFKGQCDGTGFSFINFQFKCFLAIEVFSFFNYYPFRQRFPEFTCNNRSGNNLPEELEKDFQFAYIIKQDKATGISNDNIRSVMHRQSFLKRGN